MLGKEHLSTLNRPQAFVWMTLLASLLCVLPQAAGAEQRLDLEGTAIFGNKESPNILYVVPWRKSDQIGPVVPPGMGQLNEILSPLDREVFRRQVDWHQTFGEKP